MMMTLFQLVLFTGIVPFVLSVNRKYYLIQEMKPWNEAQVYCQATYTDLAIIQDSDDLVQIQNETEGQSFTSEAWIGLYNDVNSWRWSFGNIPLEFENWMLGEPNNKNGKQECVQAFSTGWNDRVCDSSASPICFDAMSTGLNSYIVISQAMTWYDAQSYCRQHHTDLAIIKDSNENTEVTKLVPDGGAWIGLFRDSWKWIDQTNMSTILWETGQPDNQPSSSYCGVVKNGKAADVPCADTKAFFCYAPITGRKQTIRLKIQSQQNVNDPAVKAGIWEKIKEKLKEHGMAANTTVKWIEKPGGVVFHKEECHNDRENESEESCDVLTFSLL